MKHTPIITSCLTIVLSFLPCVALAAKGMELLNDGFELVACEAQTPLPLNSPTPGSTDTDSASATWSNQCALEHASGILTEGPETVYSINVLSTQFLEYTLTPITNTFFGAYLRGSCPLAGSEFDEFCVGNEIIGEVVSFTRLTPPGTHSLFVDDFGPSGNGPGDFTIEVTPALTPACNGLLPEVLLIENAPLQVSADTASGGGNNPWSITGCQAQRGTTTGQSLAYGIALAKPASVQITVTPTNPANSDIALFVRAVCDDRFSEIACTWGDDGAPAVLNLELSGGDYYIFIDDFILNDETQEFDLDIVRQ